jgi:ERCC4-type nuclease
VILILDLYKYTDKEKDQLIKSIVILTDSRERKSTHILSWFDKKKISHEVKALSNGDYSFYIPSNEQLNIDRPLYFDKKIMIERKASLDELSGNLTQNRDRFEKEMSIYQGKKYLLIENSSYADIVNQNYKTKFNPKSYLGSLHSFNQKYNLEIIFMPDNQYSGLWIYETLVHYFTNIIR